MWEGVLQNRFAVWPKRKFIPLLLAAIALVFAYLIAAAPTANAADAQWETGSLVYEDKKFVSTNSADLPEGVNVPQDAKIFMYVGETAMFRGTDKEIIYFTNDEDISRVSEAQYMSYRQGQSDVAENVIGPRTITIDTETADQAEQISEEDIESGASSCKVDGLGWIICPLTTQLAKGMDWIFGVIQGFLEVRPLQTSNDNVMMRSWGIMRSVANIAFVIAFLVIIYAQVTTLGVSNYGIKKLLPRLIIAAILVNLSYWICALAIDLSNILGASLQQVFINMRNIVLGSNSNSWDLISWESVAGFALSGGAIGGATIIGGMMTLGSLGAAGFGAFYLLLPVLLMAFLSVLVVLLILTARQAIITILVIIAPLAFVAYLLPNTEKWFEKWKDLFMTMLILFPAFSLVFGGAQLAGILIIQNADDITVVILGMAVQVAPLAIVPLLLKLGGSLLTRIAGMVNNPNRGMIDRAKKYSQARYDQSRALQMRRNRGMSATDLKKPRNALKRYAMYRDDDKREREGLQKVNETMGDALYMNSESGHRLHEAEHTASVKKEQIENAVKTELQAKINVPGAKLHVDQINLEASKAMLAEENKRTERTMHEYQTERAAELRQANGINLGAEAEVAIAALSRATRGVAIQNYRDQNANRVINNELANALTSDEVLRQEAGGIAEHGADSALASAISTMRSDYGKNVEDARQIVKHFNLSSEQRQAHAMGEEVTVTDNRGNTRTFQPESIFTREAVIEDQLTTGTVPMVQEIIMNSGGSLAEFRTTIADTTAKAGLGNKAQYLGGSTINEIAKGTISSPEKFNGIVQDFIAKAKVKPETIAKMDKDALETILKAAKTTDKSYMTPSEVAKFDAGIQKLKHAANYAATNDELKAFTAENAKPILEKIRNL